MIPILLKGLMLLCSIIYLNSCGNRNAFKAPLIQVDTASVTTIVIDAEPGRPAMTFKREGSTWIASRGSLSFIAVPDQVNLLLRNLSLIETEYLAAKQAEEWTDFSVSEKTGARLRIYQGSRLLEDFFIGDFKADPEAQTAVSYLRLAGEEEVYAVNGFQALPLTRPLSSYRDPTLFCLSTADEIYRLDYERPDTIFTFSSDGDRWTSPGGTAIDSAEISGYLRGLRRLDGAHFANQFDELQAGQFPHYSIVLHLHHRNDSLRIDLYRDSTRKERPFIIQSSQRPDTFFASDSSGLYRTIFAIPEEWVLY